MVCRGTCSPSDLSNAALQENLLDRTLALHISTDSTPARLPSPELSRFFLCTADLLPFKLVLASGSEDPIPTEGNPIVTVPIPPGSFSRPRR